MYDNRRRRSRYVGCCRRRDLFDGLSRRTAPTDKRHYRQSQQRNCHHCCILHYAKPPWFGRSETGLYSSEDPASFTSTRPVSDLPLSHIATDTMSASSLHGVSIQPARVIIAQRWCSWSRRTIAVVVESSIIRGVLSCLLLVVTQSKSSRVFRC